MATHWEPDPEHNANYIVENLFDPLLSFLEDNAGCHYWIHLDEPDEFRVLQAMISRIPRTDTWLRDHSEKPSILVAPRPLFFELLQLVRLDRLLDIRQDLLSEPARWPDGAEQGFFQAIHEDPEDSVHQLVYADWLEERDDVRAEFIRLQASLPVNFRRVVPELSPGDAT